MIQDELLNGSGTVVETVQVFQLYKKKILLVRFWLQFIIPCCNPFQQQRQCDYKPREIVLKDNGFVDVLSNEEDLKFAVASVGEFFLPFLKQTTSF